MGLECGRSGVSIVEVHNPHSGVEAEGEAKRGSRKGLALCMGRCRGYSLDHSAAMVSDEQVEGFKRDLHSHLKGSGTSRRSRTGKSRQQRAGRMLREDDGQGDY